MTDPDEPLPIEPIGACQLAHARVDEIDTEIGAALRQFMATGRPWVAPDHRGRQVTSYRTAKIQPAAPWSPVADPYRDTRAAAAFFLSWLPALLCGARIDPAPVVVDWFMCGVRFSFLLPKISAVAP